MPPLTEERRREFVKRAGGEGEQSKVAIRSIRREAIEMIKKLVVSGVGVGFVPLMSVGEVPAADMFKEAQDDNRMWTWLIRAGGILASERPFTSHI